MLRFRPGGLGVLESAVALKQWPQLLEDLDRLAAAYRILELADALEEGGAIHAEFFDAIEAGLEGVACDTSCGDAALRAEARLLSLAGWAPRMDACVSCRQEAPFKSPRLSLSEGGLLCPMCKSGDAWLALGPGAASALQRLFHSEAGQVSAAGPPLRRFVEYQLGKALKTGFFQNSIQVSK
jgi:DNA repair protein RecO (recombination protein O)